ncbi:TonB-dependent receptor [Novosphingobium sp. G106]|uniref:TonB-dependent receptor n=1 Tax=Novosphingobium sp. G106 TaxID=2849500 RepID=UPI0020C2A4AC|nr:TonB-dependent receptor [Novosphingobium sp. G106]
MSRSWGSSLVVEGAIGETSIKSITAYREVNRTLNNLDQDATPFEMLQIYRNSSKQHQFSQELQFYGKALDNDLDWIVGAYYFSEKGRDEVISHFVYPLGPNFTITDGTAFNRNLAVFGQVTYSITNQIQFVGGIRYASDRRRLDVYSRNASTTNGAPGTIASCAITGATVPTCLVPLPNKTFSYVPLTVGVNYKPSSNALIYLKWSRGFRSGGYNTRGVSANTLLPFGPEKVDSYELGAKFEVARALRVSGDVFQSDFTDIQILANVAFGPGTTVALSQNAGTARIRGLELEAEAALGALRLSGSLALLDAKYKKLSPTVVGLVAGSPFAYTPKTTFTLSGDYTVSLASTDVVLHADYAWRSRVYFAPVPPNDPLNQQASYGLINASLAAKLANGFTFSVFGKNLANKRYLNRTTSIPTLGFLSGYPGDPRTYGVSAAYRF